MNQHPPLLLGRNQIHSTDSTDAQPIGNYLDAVKAMARLTYQSLYVIDYETMSFEHVSDNPLFLCGHTAQQVQAMGYGFYYEHVPPADLALLDRINNIGFDFYEQLPLDQNRKHYTISYDFHLVNSHGHSLLINHRLTPLFLNQEGKIWKALCLVSLSNNQQSGHVMIYKEGTDLVWTFDFEQRIWRVSQKGKLTERGLQILQLHAQGLSITQIADRLGVSPDTVKYHRRKIFADLDAQHINEALFFATSRKLL